MWHDRIQPEGHQHGVLAIPAGQYGWLHNVLTWLWTQKQTVTINVKNVALIASKFR
jgi:hypothetical protein